MPLYFDHDLSRVGADKLKPMVKLWGGDSKMRKDECIACICAGLKDPQKVQAAISSLASWERNALALIKRMGGVIQFNVLKVGLLACGLHPRRTYSYRDDFIEPLFRRGLILATDSYSPDYFSENYSYSTRLYSDERLLAQVGFPEYAPMEIPHMQAHGEIHFRRTSAVALDVLGMLQAIENMGGLKLTQSGTVRVNDEIKLRKALHWDEQGLDVDGFLFPNPVQAWLGAFRYSDLLEKTGDSQLIIKNSPDHFARRPFREQIYLLLEGFLRSSTWWELPVRNTYLDNDGKGRNQGRLALMLALSALPLNPEVFFSIRDFDQALYNRIGEDFALDYPPRRPFFYGSKTPELQKQELLSWQQKTRTEWLKQEFPWLASAFTTWLYFLGLVELVVEGSQLTGFRLTQIGREIFHPELATVFKPEVHATVSDQPAWIVQPNFDIIVYLDRVNALQLAFLERHAERAHAHKHTAHYRINRESIYRGLESGTTLDQIITTLQTGSQAELSQNIIVELHEWASLREKISLRRNAQLLEFPSAQTLQDEFAQGLVGTVVAERFLLLTSSPIPPLSGLTRINYAEPLPKDLTVTETGIICLKHGAHDMVTAAQLSQWAIPISGFEWQLTAKSVSVALRPGRKITELLILLNNRLKHSLPPLLELALRSWAGESYTIELESVIVVRCPQEEVFQAIVTSPLIKPALKGYLDPNLLFVIPDQVEIFHQYLHWLGFGVSDQLQTIPIVSHRKAHRPG
ncbi:MAG TPA: helicase-associated domain-containing protein [Anaerolineales bacterium]|nr:helicase-associated domain-containing protein [Anaerolineales bacterium]